MMKIDVIENFTRMNILPPYLIVVKGRDEISNTIGGSGTLGIVDMLHHRRSIGTQPRIDMDMNEVNRIQKHIDTYILTKSIPNDFSRAIAPCKGSG